MSDDKKKEQPFKSLGAQLKRLRQKVQESVAEVAGAVEIECDTLAKYEEGKVRPGEDILLLLISHFGIKETEASKLWKLAGYDAQNLPNNPLDDNQTAVVVMPGDAHIQYTDMVHVIANNFGVVLNFLQSSGPKNQPMIISRVGMSKEHAKSVMELLQKTLEQTEPKALPSKSTKKSKTQRKTDK